MVFEEIRHLNERILARDPWRAAELEQRVQTLAHRLELNRVASDREYFAALHLKSTLAELVSRLRDHLGAG